MTRCAWNEVGLSSVLLALLTVVLRNPVHNKWDCCSPFADLFRYGLIMALLLRSLDGSHSHPNSVVRLGSVWSHAHTFVCISSGLVRPHLGCRVSKTMSPALRHKNTYIAEDITSHTTTLWGGFFFSFFVLADVSALSLSLRLPSVPPSIGVKRSSCHAELGAVSSCQKTGT